MQKARISVHTGAVKDFIGQFHVDITATSTSELSDDILARKIQDTSGSGTRVLDEVLVITFCTQSFPLIPSTIL